MNYKSLSWTDEQLMELVQNDNAEAFTEIYNRYWKKLFLTAANKLKDKPVAEELTQEIMADVWQRRKYIKITTTLRAYLSVSMKYKVIDYLARLNQRQRYADHIRLQATSADLSTENWLSFEELRTRLERLVNDLPDKCRIVYQLSKEQGYKNKQIAEDQGISEKTVEAHLTRAMKVLRSKLTNFIFFIFF